MQVGPRGWGMEWSRSHLLAGTAQPGKVQTGSRAGTMSAISTVGV